MAHQLKMKETAQPGGLLCLKPVRHSFGGVAISTSVAGQVRLIAIGAPSFSVGIIIHRRRPRRTLEASAAARAAPVWRTGRPGIVEAKTLLCVPPLYKVP